MNLIINGKTEEIDLVQGTVLEMLKAKKVLVPESVAVALNGETLRRFEYENTFLKDGDRIDIRIFIGGG